MEARIQLRFVLPARVLAALLGLSGCGADRSAGGDTMDAGLQEVIAPDAGDSVSPGDLLLDADLAPDTSAQELDSVDMGDVDTDGVDVAPSEDAVADSEGLDSNARDGGDLGQPEDAGPDVSDGMPLRDGVDAAAPGDTNLDEVWDDVLDAAKPAPVAWTEYPAFEDAPQAAPSCPERPIACSSGKLNVSKEGTSNSNPRSRFIPYELEIVDEQSLIRVRAMWTNIESAPVFMRCTTTRSDILPTGVATWLLDMSDLTVSIETFEAYPNELIYPPPVYYEPDPSMVSLFEDPDLYFAAFPNASWSPPAMVADLTVGEATVQAWGQYQEHDGFQQLHGGLRVVLSDGTVVEPGIPVSACQVPMEDLRRSNCYCDTDDVYPLSVGKFSPDALDGARDYVYFEALERPFGYVSEPSKNEFVAWYSKLGDPTTDVNIHIGVSATLLWPGRRPRVNWLTALFSLPQIPVGQSVTLTSDDPDPPMSLWPRFSFSDGHQRGQFDTLEYYDVVMGHPRFVAFTGWPNAAFHWLTFTVDSKTDCRISGTFEGMVLLQPGWQGKLNTPELGPAVPLTNGHFRATNVNCYPLD